MFGWGRSRNERRVNSEVEIEGYTAPLSPAMQVEMLMLEKLDLQNQVDRLEDSQRGYAIANGELNANWKKSEEMVALLSNENAQLKAANLATLAKFREERKLQHDAYLEGVAQQEEKFSKERIAMQDAIAEELKTSLRLSSEIHRLNDKLVLDCTEIKSNYGTIDRRNAEIVRIHSALSELLNGIECPDIVEEEECKFKHLIDLGGNNFSCTKGTWVTDGIQEAQIKANQLDSPVRFEHNGNTVELLPADTTEKAYQRMAKQTVNDRDCFRVTEEWIDEHATTPSGGWTYAQFESVGLPSPPVKGWRKKLVGKLITKEQAKAFEQAKFNKRPS